jgi:hypothetical protein
VSVTYSGVLGAPTWRTSSAGDPFLRSESTPIYDQLQAELLDRRIAKLIRARDARGRFTKP